MKCQICNKRQACVHLARVINGAKTEQHLCAECAKEQGISGFMPLSLNFNSFLTPLYEQSAPIREERCPTCKMPLGEFSQTGLFGCPDCYTAFGDRLLEPLKRIHGSAAYRGRTPKKSADPAAELRKELQEAIAAERYEDAAGIRDRLKQLEGGNK